MLYKTALLIVFLLIVQKNRAAILSSGLFLKGSSIDSLTNTEFLSDENLALEKIPSRPSPLLKSFRVKQRKGKKVIATLLAFPLPFGIVGLHRIYLGSAPYVPVVYIATLGGVFGVLPFIDFCVLLAAKKTDPYINNDKIFMWVN